MSANLYESVLSSYMSGNDLIVIKLASAMTSVIVSRSLDSISLAGTRIIA
jgi:hypothetical protein